MYVDILACLKSVPDVVWSGIIAACVALAGVMISNASNTRRLLMQLSHDAREKANEKINHLRREVYLKAVEDIAIVNIQLATIANRDLAKFDISLELQTISSSMAKLKIVAEPETAKVADELNAAFGVLFLSVLPKLVPLQEAQTDIDINDSAYQSSSLERSRVLRDIQKFNEEDRQDASVRQALQKSFDWFQAQAEQYAEARALACQRRDVRQREFNAMLLPEMKELSKNQLKLIVSIRKDLGVSTDMAEMQRQLERHWAVMEAGYGDAMKGLKLG